MRLFLVVGGLITATAALADKIDGDWCSAGRHFTILGPKIVTPEGQELAGDYSRHRFSYVAPPAAPEAGAVVYMALANETTLRLHVGEDPAKPVETWRRCDVTS